MASNNSSNTETSAPGRQKADFKATVWGDFFITHVFSDQETVDGWIEGIEALKEEVIKAMMMSTEKLHLIDVVERLGIGYHFEAEIGEQLRQVYCDGTSRRNRDDIISDEDGDHLFTTALQFRLLRQHGYNVPCDIFNQFKNEEGTTFKEELGKDINGLMSLYEAAFLQTHGETILEEAVEFAGDNLRNYYFRVDRGDEDDDNRILSKRIAHVLERPLRKGAPRHEQLFFITVYEQEKGHNKTLLNLAKLSWNHLQSIYQQEIRGISKWWIDLDFATRIYFARDRLVEIYFWAIGSMWEPKYALSRYFLTKITILISVTDDMYEERGKLDELELFTSTVERWDTSMKDLPGYMRTLFEALSDVVDEIATTTTTQGRHYCGDYLKEAEKYIMRAYLSHARWFAAGEVPTVEEYKRVGIHSSAYPPLACAALCGLGEKAPKEAFEWLLSDPKIFVVVSDHCRLMDDILAHQFEQKSGHGPSMVECYMKQYEVPRNEAVKALKKMVKDDWKEINKECLIDQPSFVSKEIISMLVGLARMMEVLYTEFDGYGTSDRVTIDIVRAVLVTPMVIVDDV
ncbi:unnamed protein product [Linum trigynum]|uniref:Uncharacterized protein n=1 Tax=Linum trigynum TaxID=586398 RepID=A0AAV2GVB5_9ROSI